MGQAPSLSRRPRSAPFKKTAGPLRRWRAISGIVVHIARKCFPRCTQAAVAADLARAPVVELTDRSKTMIFATSQIPKYNSKLVYDPSEAHPLHVSPQPARLPVRTACAPELRSWNYNEFVVL